MIGPILVINPNSSRGVTMAMAEALAPLAPPGSFACVDIPGASPTISSEEDVARAALDLADTLRGRPDATACIVGCFSDPGVDLLRSMQPRPVIGIQEAAVSVALIRADLFGIIALSSTVIARHRRRLRTLGLAQRLAGEVGLEGVSALDAGRSDAAFKQSIQAGRELISLGAGAIVLGCAGFSPRRRALEEALGVPVIDPVIAAGSIALGMLR